MKIKESIMRRKRQWKINALELQKMIQNQISLERSYLKTVKDCGQMLYMEIKKKNAGRGEKR